MGAVMFVRNRGAQAPIEEITDVPDWGGPIKPYVEECINSIAKDAIVKLGQHGGYIDPYDSGLSRRVFRIDLNNPTNSDAVPLFPGTAAPIAYWFNTGGANERMNVWPNLYGLKVQIDDYVRGNIDGCIEDFQSFRDQGFDIEKTGDIIADTTITPANVLVKVIYPIRISKDGESIEVNTFRETLDVNLQEVHSLARDITYTQANDFFLEMIAMELVNIYSGVSINKLPPISMTDNEPFIITWPLDYVERMFRDKLISFIQMIDIAGTKGAKVLTSTDPFMQNIYRRFLINIGNRYPNQRVDLVYADWPMDFDVVPRSGKKITPSVTVQKPMGGVFPLGGLVPDHRTNKYQFAYDIHFPVVIKITDDDAFHGEGYSFLFALEGNVFKNKDIREIAFLGGILVPPTTGVGPGGEVTVVERNMFCDGIQQIIPVKVHVFDAKNFQPLSDVEITFGCGNFKECPVGVTEYDPVDNVAFFEGNVPPCSGGYLLLKKPGYLDKAMLFSLTNSGITYEEHVGLEPIREKEVELELYRMNSLDVCCVPGDYLKPGEMAMMTIEKVDDPDDPYALPLSNTLIFTPGGNFSDMKIKLVPGFYEITGFFYNENPYILHKEVHHICQGGVTETVDVWNPATNTSSSTCCGDDCPLGSTDCQCWVNGVFLGKCCKDASEFYPDEDIELNQLGGVTITEANGGAWRVYKADLDLSQKVILKVLVPPEAQCLSDDECIIDDAVYMDKANDIDALSAQYYGQVMPEFG
jgi:hypothetical protein